MKNAFGLFYFLLGLLGSCQISWGCTYVNGELIVCANSQFCAPSPSDAPVTPSFNQWMSSASVSSISTQTPRGYRAASRIKKTPKTAKSLAYFNAIQDDDLSLIETLAHLGFDLNQTGPEGMTPLHFAIRQGNLNAVRKLLQLGASTQRPSAEIISPLAYAEILNRQSIVDFMKSLGTHLLRMTDFGFATAHVNLREVPPESEISTQWKKNEQLTLGDLHGNTMKLIHFLIREGVMTLKNPTDYTRLYEIYESSGLIRGPTDSSSTQSQDAAPVAQGQDGGSVIDADIFIISRFEKIIKTATFNSEAPLIRMIGDELADRGENDFFTLLVLDQMKKAKVRFEILVSNHGLRFLEFYEEMLIPYAKIKNYSTRFQDFKSPMDYNPFYRSMFNLIHLLSFQEHFYFDKTIEMIKRSYLPHLKLVSYSKDAAKQFSFYTHAPAGLEVLIGLANSESFHLAYDSSAMEDSIKLAQLIDKINDKFLSLTTHKVVTRLVQLELDQLENARGGMGGSIQGIDPMIAPLYYITGVRSTRASFRPKYLLDGTLMKYIHGHDSSCEAYHNIVNLDGSLGKGDTPHDTIGEYSFYYSLDSRE